MNSLNTLLALYRTAVLEFISIIRNNHAFDVAILANFAVIFIGEIIQLQFYPYGNLPALLIWLGCASCTLHLLECAVCDAPITGRVFVNGYFAYLLVLFLWFVGVAVSVVIFKLGEVYTGNEILWIPAIIIYYGTLLLPIAELLYQSPIRGLQICSAAFHFAKTHWLEWLIPHMLLIGLYIFSMNLFMAKEYSHQTLAYLSWLLLYGPFLHLLLLFRGTLFAVLNTSTEESQKTTLSNGVLT